ncbi:aminomethyl-transferring glycine dehydrogenase subunit GcvPA [Geochorda subterranea]|uniref:Probable glycine dehydrogenase (decarboxylating) subunit 1 n=1 Tax=Geochorda subterranea TaxID=3109564 RepID=A0ABZ1BQ08_9FIRM|nr:aminomethyl-transferring glycine dehydrogenase subunit GcvPA [Limnochorda sp. LNt]WRP14670.1 aminomethyl-transferring glycine dehydrogenase subunit GcvPA [Limnochorda sp. LNt]
MDFVPLTPAEREAMLARIGVKSVDELFADIPPQARLDRPLDLPPAMSEAELIAHMRTLAARNADLDRYVCFLGGGAYDHLIPSVVRHILGRSEFYTAYTPYQAEVSQGVLQTIFEYQTLVCQLTGLDVANASMYDGASAAAEAALMATAHTGRRRVVVSAAVHPEYRQVMATYLANQDVALDTVPWRMGVTHLDALQQAVDDRTAAVVMQNPNFFGAIEEMDAAAAIAHRHGALLVAVVDPISLGILAPPGEYGADIAVGEGQALGNAISFGGPYLGFFAARRELIRRMPGRIVGISRDVEGRRGFVLTLQTREQHIRRERATSNICTNQALNALAATVYLAMLGRQGIRRVGELCVQKSHYAFERLTKVPGIRPAWDAPFFKEFVVEMDGAVPEVLTRLWQEYGIIGGLPLGRFYDNLDRAVLWCVTEARTRDEIDRLVAALHQLG